MNNVDLSSFIDKIWSMEINQDINLGDVFPHYKVESIDLIDEQEYHFIFKVQLVQSIFYIWIYLNLYIECSG